MLYEAIENFINDLFIHSGIANFSHYQKEPILKPGRQDWQKGRVYNPAAIVINDKVALLYRAQGVKREFSDHHWQWPSVIGLAWSKDGLNFESDAMPLLKPEKEWEAAGVEDPRIVKIGEKFVVTYTAYDGKKARLALLQTKDAELREWKERRLVFPDEVEWNKSGAILPQAINGKYFMYYQKHIPYGKENYIWLAHSADLLHWEQYPLPVLVTRKGHFDERLVEPGPPPVLLPEGILFIYNAAKFSSNYFRRVFSVGWVLFDRHDPTQIIARCREPFITAEHYSEKKGRLPRVSFRSNLKNGGRVDATIFSEGLCFFDNKWFLYYGMGDTTIGVAVSKSKKLFF